MNQMNQLNHVNQINQVNQVNQVNPMNPTNQQGYNIDPRNLNNNFNIDMNLNAQRVKSSIDRHDYDILKNDKGKTSYYILNRYKKATATNLQKYFRRANKRAKRKTTER